MKKLAALAFLIALQATAQDNEKACSLFIRLNEVLQSKHYKPKPVDDSLSVYVFNTVMDDLDENRILFIQSEYDVLAKHKDKIDDHIKDRDCSFFSDFITQYRNALQRNRRFIEEIAKEPLTYNSKDTIYFSKKTFPYHTKEDRIKKFMRKKITYEILEDIALMSKNKDSLGKNVAKLFPASKNKIIDTWLCRTDNLLSPSEGFENSVYNKFYTAFCTWFDPHSTYFNYNEKESFVSTISTENYSLGLYVSQNEKEEIVVEEVVPGGPAFISKKIEKGDKLIKLASNNTEYSVSCTSMEAITNIVTSDTYKNVELTLRKKDGTLYNVNLTKQVMKAEDHSVYSYVVGDSQKMGYIKVPSFYSAFETGGENGCADDVAKEVDKLKKQGVSGLIIDLQYNGGGSMDEVMRMAGMFINYGPIAVVTDKEMKYNTVRDYNRGMVFNGPMVVLVNGFTASASEFFAGVMQDYNRAVIVGTTTVGKATMQTILPLEEASQANFVKVTIDKFYRVTGHSSQYLGIVPDVALPAFFDDMLPREKTMPTAIKNDSIDVHPRFTRMPAEALKNAIAVSRRRVAASARATKVTSMNTQITTLYKAEKPPLPVTFTKVYDEVHGSDSLFKEISAEMEQENGLIINGTLGAQPAAGSDDYLKSVNEYKIKSIKTDPYILEGINILKDLSSYKAH